MAIQKIALFFERNKWIPETLSPVVAMIFCSCLGYFTVVFMGQLTNATPVTHTVAAIMLLLSGVMIAIIYKACSHIDKKSGY